MSIIDEKLAKAFLDDPDNVDLFEATKITDDAAELLSKHEGSLDLDSLTKLSDAIASKFHSHKGGTLSLTDCSRISDKAIEILASRKGDLTLGITSLSDASVAALATHEGRLKLPELEEVEGKHAAVLSSHSSALLMNASDLHYCLNQRSPRYLKHHYEELATEGERLLAKKLYDSQISVDDEIKKANQQHVIDANMAMLDLIDSYLDGTGAEQINTSDKKALSDEAAEIFSKQKGGSVHLEGLTEISDKTADLLGKGSNWLHLGKSVSLSASGWKSLLRHKGWLDLKLESLPDEVASALSQYQGDHIFLKELGEISDAGIKSLTEYSGTNYAQIDFGTKRKTSHVRKRFKSFSRESWILERPGVFAKMK